MTDTDYLYDDDDIERIARDFVAFQQRQRSIDEQAMAAIEAIREDMAASWMAEKLDVDIAPGWVRPEDRAMQLAATLEDEVKTQALIDAIWYGGQHIPDLVDERLKALRRARNAAPIEALEPEYIGRRRAHEHDSEGECKQCRRGGGQP